MQTKYVFLTGGVVSSVGKGVTAAALGRLLKSHGFKVAIQKLDPYINVDPGTMSPYQHGEVFVLDDGAETDLDLGHYERFADIRLNKVCNVTTGQVYAEVIGRERHGDYLGGTIQTIPHVTNEIKRRIQQVAQTTGAEIVLCEVGGTVGDIESEPFLETLRQLRSNLGRENTFYIHVTWLVYLAATKELKTKPTQHSVRELRSVGISPDMIIARSDHEVTHDLCEKIAAFCDVDINAVVPMKTADKLYDVPIKLEEAKVGEYIIQHFGLESRQAAGMTGWHWLSQQVHKEKPKVKIALVGKYIELQDAYISVREALEHACLHLGVELDLSWVHSADLERSRGWDKVQSAHGIVVPGGFGQRGIEGKIAAGRYAREHKVPYLGLCLGMQTMCIEFARHINDTEDANSTEFDPNTAHPVISLMPDQQHITDKGGTMRLGLYPCELQEGSISRRAYGVERIDERHRHRFEFNNAYRKPFEENGMRFAGLSPDGRLVEVVEMVDHPFMVASQFHPEFLSRPTRPHPLFREFIRTACEINHICCGNLEVPPEFD
jgi:CTP synthase